MALRLVCELCDGRLVATGREAVEAHVAMHRKQDEPCRVWWVVADGVALVPVPRARREQGMKSPARRTAAERRSALILITLGTLLALLGSFESSLAQRLQQMPMHAEDLNVRGNNLGKAGKYREAIALYTEAIALDPQYAEPYYNRGKAKLNLKDYRGAIVDFDAALKLTPDNADTYNNRGIARKKLGDTEGALEDYKTALMLNPTLYQVYLNRGIAHFDRGDQARACDDFLRAAAHHVPQAPEALRQAGCAGR